MKQQTIKQHLDLGAKQLSRFLDNHLPGIGGENWWQTHVFSQLTYGQQGQVRRRGIERIGGLDLAALLRVFDRNWAELSYRCDLSDELRTYLRETAGMRNRHSHAAADGDDIAAGDAYRDLDTLVRLMEGLGGDSETVRLIEDSRDQMLAEMASGKLPPTAPVVEVREIVREVPVEKEVRIEVPVATVGLAEPEGGTPCGRFRLHSIGEATDGRLPGFDGKEVDASLWRWRVYGEPGQVFDLQVAMIDEGTASEVAQVVCTSRNQSHQAWDDVVKRLRIGIRDAGGGCWIMDLRPAVRTSKGRATRNKWSISEYDQRTGLNLQSELTKAGATEVGIRGDLIGDTGKRRDFPAVLFPSGDPLIPVVAWVLLTLETLIPTLSSR